MRWTSGGECSEVARMNDDPDKRPSPDALLAEAQREGRGHLKVFLGAAPGVGKTYAMLEASHERRREGVDVVAGVVETHGRRETQALLDGIEVVPQVALEYRGRSFREMDLDGLLTRRPQLALVDELAHTNVPGVRHVKRWQDVEELLDAGIDVYTTLNIQHLESLNDVVEQISGIKVRETVPDNVLSTADEIELIDLPPDDLIKRLREGKVYVPEQARRAIHNFFSPGNLTALREMALRHAAERVDRQMVDYMRAHAIPGPWPARERMSGLHRRKRRMRSAWCGSRHVRLSGAARRGSRSRWRTPAPMRLPRRRRTTFRRRFGWLPSSAARRRSCKGEDVVSTILRYARERNVTQIIVGRASRRSWFRRFGSSVTDRLIERAVDFNVLVVGGEEEERPKRAATVSRRPLREGLAQLSDRALQRPPWRPGLGLVIDLWLPIADISVVYLLAVLIVAIKSGLRAAITASFASFLAFNFVFTDPRWTFPSTNTQHALTIVFFLDRRGHRQ